MKNNNESGFTLVEILVAISFIVIGMFAIITVFTSLLVTNIQDETENIALKIAQKDIEYVRGLDFNQIGIVGAASPDPTGILTDSQLVTSGDSRFSFVGAKHDSKYTVTRTVVWIDDPADATADNDYKRFRTTVTWTSPSPGGNVSLTSDFQPTSVTTSLNQAPLIQFLEPQINNQTLCGTQNFEVYAVDPEDLDDITVSITITNTSYPNWAKLLTDPADVIARPSSFDIVFGWNSATVTDDAIAYRLLAVAADTSSKLNSTTRTIFLDNQPAVWSSSPNVTATYDGSKVLLSWDAATNVPSFLEYSIIRTDLDTSTTTESDYFASSITSSEDSSVVLGHEYEYTIRTRNACGVTSDSSSYAGGTASVQIPASVSFNLTTSFTGAGSIDVQYPGTTGPCNFGSGCLYTIPAGTTVTLDANPGPGYNFTTWSTGPCSGTSTNPCNFVIGSNTAASTAFSLTPPPTRSLTVTAGTGGSVRIQYATIDVTCTTASSPCTRTGIPDLTPITLTGQPSSGYSFTNWSTGTPCTGLLTNSVCSFNISANTSTTATFTLNTAPTWVSGYPTIQTDTSGNGQIVLVMRATDTTAANLTYKIQFCVRTNNGSCTSFTGLPAIPDQVAPNNTLVTYTHTGLTNANYYTYRIRVCDDTSPTPLCTPSSSTYTSVVPDKVRP